MLRQKRAGGGTQEGVGCGGQFSARVVRLRFVRACWAGEWYWSRGHSQSGLQNGEREKKEYFSKSRPCGLSPTKDLSVVSRLPHPDGSIVVVVVVVDARWMAEGGMQA